MDTNPMIEPVARTKDLAGAPADVTSADDTEGCMMKETLNIPKGQPGGPNGSYGMLFDFITDPFGTVAKVAAKGKGW